MKYDWDSAKAVANEQKHGVSFDEACEAFDAPSAFHFFDDAHSIGEIRYNVVGASSRRLLFVVYTERGDVTRIISAREAGNYHRKLYERQEF
ncbi:MAG TPA: BrnT family toxin [Blastocatellia bacterium]|nr:BrnT family toxin [Blastocatellia bacterium]